MTVRHDAAHAARSGTPGDPLTRAPVRHRRDTWAAIPVDRKRPQERVRRSRVANRRRTQGTQRAVRLDMMNTVRDTFSSIGDRGGEIVRSVGSGTAGLARRVGSGTADVARQIGPRRVMIGLAIAAVAIGGSILVMRYLRARRERDVIDLGEEDLSAASRIVSPDERMPGLGVRAPL